MRLTRGSGRSRREVSRRVKEGLEREMELRARDGTDRVRRRARARLRTVRRLFPPPRQLRSDSDLTPGARATASSSDWESPRRPHKRVCRPPLVANQQHLVPPPRPPGSSSFDLASAAFSPPDDVLNDLDRTSPSFARLPPFELAFYKDCSSDSSDSDEDSVGPPSQPPSDAERSGENQVRPLLPPPSPTPTSSP